MTTTQTIDGVPRKALADFIEYSVMGPYGDESVWQADKDKLRALLDAPACSACNDTGRMHEPGCEPGACTACVEKPAAQPQGKPVYMVRSHGSCCWEEMRGESLEMCQAQPGEYEVRKLYAEQPAPVAVEQYQNKINHLKQLLRNVRATLHFSPEDVLEIDAALREDGE